MFKFGDYLFLLIFIFLVQVERKRHIGNDIVNIIFVDGDCCDFTPNCIKSQFTRILFYEPKKQMYIANEIISIVAFVNVVNPIFFYSLGNILGLRFTKNQTVWLAVNQLIQQKKVLNVVYARGTFMPIARKGITAMPKYQN